jgi:LPXTG-motif cell wall-anchored protein
MSRFPLIRRARTSNINQSFPSGRRNHRGRRLGLFALLGLIGAGSLALASAQQSSAAGGPPSSSMPDDDHDEEESHGSFTAIVEAEPEGDTAFIFSVSPTSMPPMTPSFTLIDNGTASDTQMIQLRREKQYTFAMNLPEGWMLDDVSCEVEGDNGGTQQVNGASAVIDYKEGEMITCRWMVTQKMPSIELVKTADPATYSGVGETITYTYEITNTGNVALGPDQFEISDDMIDDGEAFDCGDDDAEIDVDESITCEMEYLTTADDVTAGSVTNTAMAMLGDLESEEATATVTYVAPTTTTAAPTTTTTIAATTTTATPTTTAAPTTTATPTTVIAQTLPSSIDVIVSGALPVLLPQSTVATTTAPTTTAVTVTAQALPATGGNGAATTTLAGLLISGGSALAMALGRRRRSLID